MESRRKDFKTPNGKIYFRKLVSSQPEKDEIRLEIVRLLEEKLGIENIRIEHTAAGQPFIAEQESIRISISHSHNLVAVYVSSDYLVGIDIELENPNIHKVKSHFINEREETLFHPLSAENLHLIWGAKEAIYKYFKGNFIALENEVTILRIEAGRINAETIHGPINCAYEIMDAHVYLVWTEV